MMKSKLAVEVVSAFPSPFGESISKCSVEMITTKPQISFHLLSENLYPNSALLTMKRLLDLGFHLLSENLYPNNIAELIYKLTYEIGFHLLSENLYPNKNERYQGKENDVFPSPFGESISKFMKKLKWEMDNLCFHLLSENLYPNRKNNIYADSD